MTVPAALRSLDTALSLWVSLVAWMVLEWCLVIRDYRAGIQRLKNADRNSAQKLVMSFLVTLVGALVVTVRFGSLQFPWPPAVSTVLGCALIWLGVGLRFWAIRTLGRFFRLVVLIQEDHGVVQDGPYRWIRHPAYTGSWLSLLGFAIALGNGAALVVCLLVPLFGFLPRIHAEEDALAQSLGDQYTTYSARTRRLIPGVW